MVQLQRQRPFGQRRSARRRWSTSDIPTAEILGEVGRQKGVHRAYPQMKAQLAKVPRMEFMDATASVRHDWNDPESGPPLREMSRRAKRMWVLVDLAYNPCTNALRPSLNCARRLNTRRLPFLMVNAFVSKQSPRVGRDSCQTSIFAIAADTGSKGTQSSLSSASSYHHHIHTCLFCILRRKSH